MSVVDLNLLGQLTTAADGLASSIIANMPTVKVEVEAAQASVQYFDFGFGDYSDYKDLVDFSTILTNSGCQEVQTAAQSVLQAASKAVTHEGHYTPGMAKAHGISVYLPTPGPNSWLTRYQATQFAQQTHWDEMIAQY